MPPALGACEHKPPPNFSNSFKGGRPRDSTRFVPGVDRKSVGGTTEDAAEKSRRQVSSRVATGFAGNAHDPYGPANRRRAPMTQDRTGHGRLRLFLSDFHNSGVLWGTVAVLAFSLTVPLTRIAAPVFGGLIAGLGRAALAALIAGPLLFATSQPRPKLRDVPTLMVVGLGLLVGYPLFLSLGLETVPSIHGAVTSGLLPVATAVAAVVLASERPSTMFWVGTLAGVVAVLTYAIMQGGGTLVAGDAWLLCAVVSAGIGNATGGLMARRMGGWRTICWALLVVSPLTFSFVLYDSSRLAIQAPVGAWISLLYLGIVSSLLAFCAWVKGLSMGGIARIGQLQLLQPFTILPSSAILLGEHVTVASLAASAIVFVCAAFCLRARASKPSNASTRGV
jgi:drug/metabolite transporter (DMT)-like permease